MILTVDLSNSYITVGVVSDGNVVYSGVLSTVRQRTSDEYFIMMSLILERNHVDVEKLEGCILSSVVPELTIPVRKAAELLTGICPMVVGPGVKTGLNIRLDDPSELGSDFVAASLAAQAHYSLPLATVALDTAMGIGVTDANGTYIGGVIAPGVMISTSALSSRASLLHNVIPKAPRHIICKSTDESMRSGIIYGAAAMLDGLLLGVEEELGQPLTVVATGTWAETVIPHCRRKGIYIDKYLIHEGLWLIWKRNQRK